LAARISAVRWFAGKTASSFSSALRHVLSQFGRRFRQPGGEVLAQIARVFGT